MCPWQCPPCLSRLELFSWVGGRAGHPRQACVLRTLWPTPPAAYHRCLVLPVISYCGRPLLLANFHCLCAYLLLSHCPTATAKVTDDLLIARSQALGGSYHGCPLCGILPGDPPAASLARAGSWCLRPLTCWAPPTPMSRASAGSASSALGGMPRAPAACSAGMPAPMASSPPLPKALGQSCVPNTQILPSL